MLLMLVCLYSVTERIKCSVSLNRSKYTLLSALLPVNLCEHVARSLATIETRTVRGKESVTLRDISSRSSRRVQRQMV